MSIETDRHYHCPDCLTAWPGAEPCWSCGKPGEPGVRLFQHVQIIPGLRFVQPTGRQ